MFPSLVPTPGPTFSQRLAAFRESAHDWFDGTPQSIDRRMEKCSTLIATATAAVANDQLDQIPTVTELTADRKALAAMREDLLNGASGREAGQAPSGRRPLKLSSADARRVYLGSRAFYQDNLDARYDLPEIAERARRYAQVECPHLTEAFVASVVESAKNAPPPPRTAAVQPSTGFPDGAMFL